jgi:hypothetical protein
MAVTLLVVGVDAGGLDRELDLGAFRLGQVAVDRAAEIGEAAAHLAHEVPHLEADFRVRLVDGVGLGVGAGAGRAQGEQQTGGHRLVQHGHLILPWRLRCSGLYSESESGERS